MKNFLVVCALGFATLANAQSGSWYVGGTGGFNSSKVEGSDATSVWNLSPEVGTFFSDHVQVGVGFNLTGVSWDNGESSFGVTPYTRYFFKPGQAFRPFVGAALPISSSKTFENLGEVKRSSFGVKLNAGFAYALAPRWAVVGQLGALSFAKSSNKYAGGQKIGFSEFGLGGNTLGSPFNIGLYYTFKQ